MICALIIRACAERVADLLNDLLMQLDLPAGSAAIQPELVLADRAQAAIDNELVELRERLDELVAVYRQAAEPATATKAA